MSPSVWSWFPDWWGPHYETLLIQLADPSFDPILLLRYAVQALLTTSLIFLADYVLGLAILRVLRLRLEGGLRHASALGLGTGAAGLGIFLFGSIGHLTFRGVLVFTFLQCLLGLTYAKNELRQPRWRWRYLWGLLVLAIYVPDLLMPVVEYDSTMYHMAAARHYMEYGQISYHSGIRFNAQPHLPVMLYMRQWWLNSDANVIKLVNLEYFAMLIGVFTWLARRYRVRGGMLAAAGLCFGSPIFGYIVRQEYADFALTAWLTTGLVLLIARGARLNRPRLLAAALLLGSAASSKLQGLLVVSCFLAADFLIDLLRHRNPGLSLRRGLVLGGVVALVGLPWWLRGWYYAGAPFYPFFTNSPDVAALFQVNANYGVGRGLGAFLAIPWHMITVKPEVYADLFRFGPSLLVLLVIGAVAMLWRRRKLDAGSMIVILGSLLFTTAWFRSGQVMRYEACLLPVWGALLLGALARLRWRNRLASLLFLPLLISTQLMTNNVVRYSVPPPVTWPATQAVLNAILPYYRATQAASHVIGPGDKVYTWFCDDIRAYAPGLSFGDWFGGYTYTWLGNVHEGKKLTEATDMIARLKQEGFKYVIVDRQRAERGGTIYGGGFLSTGLVKPFVAVPGTETIFDDGRYAVFRLT